MKNMHIKQFLVLLMTLFALEKNAVCQKSPHTFNSAVEMWQNNSCIFPDESLYKKGALPMLDQCRLIENRVTSLPEDDLVKTRLCQSFYILSATMCEESWQLFVQSCLNPEIVQKNNLFAGTGVCSYIFGNPNISRYFTFLPTYDLCKRNCEFSSMKPVCELYAFIIYQHEHPNTCSTSEKQDEKKDKIVADPTNGKKPYGREVKIGDDSIQGKKQDSVTEESVTTPSTVSQTESTSTQLKGLTSVEATLEQKHPETVKGSESSNTAGGDIKSTPTVNGTQLLVEGLTLKNDDLKAPDIKPTSTVETLQPTEASAPKNDFKASASNKNELGVPPLLISKITATTTAEKVNTESITSPEEEITTPTTPSTSSEKVEDEGGNSVDREEDKFKGPPADHGKKNQSEFDEEEGVDDENKNENTGVSNVKLPEELETGRKQSPNTLEKNIEKPDGNAYDDSESSPGSGHFLAYFLTAVVICISGYVIYHNKQKILAFIIEGRNGGRGGRQRSKDVKYSQLKSNVEEVMPSLEQTATGKNFVY